MEKHFYNLQYLNDNPTITKYRNKTVVTNVKLVIWDTIVDETNQAIWATLSINPKFLE